MAASFVKAPTKVLEQWTREFKQAQLRNEHFVSTKTFWFPNKTLNSSAVVVICWWQRFTRQGAVQQFSKHDHKHLNSSGLRDKQDNKQAANVPKPWTGSSYLRIPDQDFHGIPGLMGEGPTVWWRFWVHYGDKTWQSKHGQSQTGTQTGWVQRVNETGGHRQAKTRRQMSGPERVAREEATVVQIRRQRERNGEERRRDGSVPHKHTPGWRRENL